MGKSDNPIDWYARRVDAGKVLAGKYHRLACARHLRDRAREHTKRFSYRLNIDKAERFFRFTSKLKHYKGRQWAGKYIELSESQRFRFGSMFGWEHIETGLRRFRTNYNELPRKNGKSIEAAMVVVYLTFFDGEAGADGYCTATKRDQALIVFGDAKKLVQKTPSLSQRIGVHKSSLFRLSTSSKLEPLSADYDSMDGLNPHVVSMDELHALKHRGMIDVVETAMGARLEPVMFQITTAGHDELSPCGDQHHYACQILDGVIEDETFFAFISHADEGDDPFAERTWQKANPHYGVSVNPADMKALASKAKHMPSALAAFKQKRLNIWVNASSPWLSLEGWKQGQSDWSKDRVAGRPCFLGVDLASKVDLAAAAFTFPPIEDDPRWRILVWCFTPEDGLEEREKMYRVPLRQWVQQGHILTTPGTRIDHVRIKDLVLEEAARVQVQLMGYDPWNIGNLEKDFQEAFGEDRVVEIPQNMAQLSEPAKEFEAEVSAGRIDGGNNPVLTWSVSVAVVTHDAKGNIFPTKNPKKLRGRIDPLMAGLFGFKLARIGADDQRAPGDYGVTI